MIYIKEPKMASMNLEYIFPQGVRRNIYRYFSTPSGKIMSDAIRDNKLFLRYVRPSEFVPKKSDGTDDWDSLELPEHIKFLKPSTMKDFHIYSNIIIRYDLTLGEKIRIREKLRTRHSYKKISEFLRNAANMKKNEEKYE